MATIVRDDTTGKQYVLLGVGFGSSQAAYAQDFTLGPTRMESESEMLAVVNVAGEISWLPSIRATVVSVDGKSCAELLAPDAS